MPRDYAKRSRENSTTSRSTRSSTRFANRASTRNSYRKKPSKSQRSYRAYKNKKQRGFKFPWRRLLLLVLLAIVGAIIILCLPLLAEKINQHIHPSAPVIEAQPVSIKPDTPAASLPPATPPVKVKFVFQDQSVTTAPSKSWKLELGSYLPGSDLTNINNELQKLKIKFQQRRIWQADQAYYRIEIGPFNSEAKAAEQQQLLRHHKIYSVITQ